MFVCNEVNGTYSENPRSELRGDGGMAVRSCVNIDIVTNPLEPPKILWTWQSERWCPRCFNV